MRTGVNRYMAFDPGGTTGWAMWEEDRPPKSIYSSDITDPLHHQELYELLDDIKPDVVIYERFQYRPNQSSTVGEDILLAREYIGVIRLWAQQHGCALHKQTPAMAKGLWADHMLKRAGVYVSGSPHRRDATRHLLYYLTVTEGRDTWVRATKPKN